MSYTLGLFSETGIVSTEPLSDVIKNIRGSIDQNRIENEFGTVIGIVFSDASFTPQVSDSNVEFIHHNWGKRNLWTGKLILPKGSSTEQVIQKLELNKISSPFLLYEETANWWVKAGTKFNFAYIPPWVINEHNYLYVAVRNTTPFTKTTLGKKWIERFGDRGDFSMLWSDKINSMIESQSKTVTEAYVKLISDHRIEYFHKGVLLSKESESLKFYAYSSAWNNNKQHGNYGIAKSGSSIYYACEDVVIDSFSKTISDLSFEEQENWGELVEIYSI